ncbi:hypothetical protein CFOL_v3_21628, partial [Cephalotus follicularis]
IHNKKLIRPNKTLLSYTAFYTDKNSETSILVINYKPFNIITPLHIVRHPIPNKKDLLKRLTKSDSTIPFKHYEWNVMSFDTPRKIMNGIFIPHSSFSTMNIDDILTFLKDNIFYKIF